MAREAPMIKVEISQPKRGKCEVTVFVLESVSANGKRATYKGAGPVTVKMKPTVRS